MLQVVVKEGTEYARDAFASAFSATNGNTLKRALLPLAIAALLFVSLAPIYIVVVVSVRTDVRTIPPALVRQSVTLDRYGALFSPGSPFLRYFGKASS